MKIIKILKKIFIYFILLIFAIWIIALGILQTQSGQNWALKQILTYVEKFTQTQIQIQKISFSFPLNLSLEGVLISQADRPLISIQNFNLCCAYTKLLQGKLVFSQLQISDVDILEFPTLFLPNHSSISWEKPVFPFYIKIEDISLSRFKINPNLLHNLNLPQEFEKIVERSSLSLNGIISNNPFKSALMAHLLIHVKSDQTNVPSFSLGLDTQNHHLSLSLHSDELPLYALQPQLFSQIKGHFAAYAFSPIVSWQALIQGVSVENAPPIQGHLKFTLCSSKEEDTLLSTFVGQQTVIKGDYLLKSRHILEISHFNIDNPSFCLNGKGILNSNLEINHGYLQGRLENFERFQKWIGKNIQGKFILKAQLDGPIQKPSCTLKLEGPRLLINQQLFENIHATIQTSSQEQSLNGSLATSFNYQENVWKAHTSFDWNEQKHLKFSHFEIKAMESNLQGHLTCLLPEFIWEGALDIDVGNIAKFSNLSKTPIDGKAKLTLEFQKLSDSKRKEKQGLRAELKAYNLSWDDWQAQQVALSLHTSPFTYNDCFPQVHASFEGQQIHWKDYCIERSNVHTLSIIDTTLWKLGLLSAEWKALNIQWKGGQAAEAIGKIQSKDPLQVGDSQIEFSIHQIQTPNIELKKFSGLTTMHASQSNSPFEIKGEGVWEENLLFTSKGEWSYQKNYLELEVQHFQGRFGPHPFKLKGPFHYTQKPEQKQLTELCLHWGEAEIQADFQQNEENILGQFKTNVIHSELFHFLAPDFPMTGKVAFQGRLEGTMQNPKAQVEVHLEQVQMIEEAFTQKPSIAGKLIFSLDEKVIRLQSRLDGFDQAPILMTGQLPIHFSLKPFVFKIDSQLPFEFSLNGEGKLDPYLNLFYNDTTNLSGQARIALKLSGQIQDPEIQGLIDLSNGTYESLSTGALYHHIEAHLEGKGKKMVLTRFSAQDKRNGQILAKGAIELDINRQFPFEFQIHPSRIFIVNSDYIDIWASGYLNLIGNTKQSKLTGELNIDQANVHLEETLPRQIKTVDIRYINTLQNEHTPLYLEEKNSHSSINLDVKLNASQNIHIEGNHLKSDWKGSLLATGTPENFQLHGDLRLIQGEFDFNGKVFNLSQGNIHFAGAPDKKTSLYIIANKDIDRITAEIIVKGPVNKPVLSFRSNPPLPQREVLSYILFNRGISDITMDQGEQLSQSFISLNSSEQTKSSTDFLSRLRNNIGIDRLDFTTKNNQENKDFGLQVGKHLTENVIVSVNQGMTSLAPIIAIEAKVHKNLKIQAEAGVAEDAPIQMSIKWKKDY